MKASDYRRAIERAVELATKPRQNGSFLSVDTQMQVFLGCLQGGIGHFDPATGRLLEQVGREIPSHAPAARAA